MTPHSHRRNWSMPPLLYRVSRGRSKMASRTAWRSVSTWADPGVRTRSTSSPWSRKRPSSWATRTARECTALLTESRSFFNVASVVMTYSLSNKARWILIPELHAHWPVVARPVFAVRAVVHYLGLVFGVVHGPGAGYASQPGGPVE